MPEHNFSTMSFDPRKRLAEIEAIEAQHRARGGCAPDDPAETPGVRVRVQEDAQAFFATAERQLADLGETVDFETQPIGAASRAEIDAHLGAVLDIDDWDDDEDEDETAERTQPLFRPPPRARARVRNHSDSITGETTVDLFSVLERVRRDSDQ